MKETNELNGYDLSRKWFNFCFENPEKIKPNHTAVYFFAIELCNRLGWKEKFGFPTTIAMESIGIKSYNTYIKTLIDLVDWGFIIMVEKSRNQYSSNIVALSNFTKPNNKALGKALSKQIPKQRESISSINKQVTINIETREQKFLSLFNTLKKQKTNKGGKFKVLSKTDLSNLNQLAKYTQGDFKKAINAMLEAKWPKDTDNQTPSHLLRVDNFNKYLEIGLLMDNEETNEEREQRLIDEAKAN